MPTRVSGFIRSAAGARERRTLYHRAPKPTPCHLAFVVGLQPQETTMIARRIAIASLIAATGAFAVSGCGMMGNRDKGMAGVMSVPLSAQNEVPPNSSTGSGTARVELDGNVLKWNVTYSGTTGPVTAGHFHGPAQPGANAGVVVPFAGPLTSPIVGSATLTPTQVDQVKQGLWYVNLHTAAHPGGELRGQVK
jgi:hypothetical protein